MNVYVESNFVLELTLLQDQHKSCEQILSLCEHRQAQLVIPAYALAEPYETLFRRDVNRKQLIGSLRAEFEQLSRSEPNQSVSDTFQTVLKVLATSGEQQKQRFSSIRDRLLQSAVVIPLNDTILGAEAIFESQYSLEPPDALICASILEHLRSTMPQAACFIEKDANDFQTQDLREVFQQAGCKLIFGFSNGIRYIQSQT